MRGEGSVQMRRTLWICYTKKAPQSETTKLTLQEGARSMPLNIFAFDHFFLASLVLQHQHPAGLPYAVFKMQSSGPP